MNKKQYRKQYRKNLLKTFSDLEAENDNSIFKKYECDFPLWNNIREEFSSKQNKKFVILEYGEFFEKCDLFFRRLEKNCVWACCQLDAFYWDFEDLKYEFWENFENINFIVENIEKFLQKIKENPEITHIWFYDEYLTREKWIEFLWDLKNNFEKL